MDTFSAAAGWGHASLCPAGPATAGHQLAVARALLLKQTCAAHADHDFSIVLHVQQACCLLALLALPLQRMLTTKLPVTPTDGQLPDVTFHLGEVQPDNAPPLMQIKLPPDAKDLIQRLLCDVEHRLGSHGIRELKVCTQMELGWCLSQLKYFPVVRLAWQ